MSREQFRRAFHCQQRRFDDELSDFRRTHESMPAEEKSQFRAWLEKLDSVEDESLWHATVHVHVTDEKVDENGNTIRWADSDFTVGTMLIAINKWDAGEDFTPNGSMP